MIAADLDRMDHLAAAGDSPVHRASPMARVAGAAATVAGALVVEDLRAAAAAAGVVLLLAAVARAEPVRVLLRSLVPLPFLVVVFLLHPETGPERMGLLLLRAGLSAMAAVVLVSTTRFADVLRVLGPVLPREVAAALAVLYRSLFLLLRSASHRMEAARLRGARGGVGAMVGGVLLESFERTENVACVMHVRGVDLPDPDRADAFRPRPWDVLPLGAGLAVLALALATLPG